MKGQWKREEGREGGDDGESKMEGSGAGVWAMETHVERKG